MLKIAIIGAGDIANIHIEAFQQLENHCKIVAISDIYEEKVNKKVEKYKLDCEIVTDYKKLLERNDIDLVSICLPPSLHCKVAVDFLDNGKHVLCEKPMAPTLEECDLMIEAAKKNKKKLSIVAQNRFKSDIMNTKKFLETDFIDDKLFIQVNSLWWRGSNYYDLWWRGTWEKEGGGCTLIHAVHHIDIMLWLMGDIEEINAFVTNKNHENSEVEDLSIVLVKFKNGAIGTLTSSLLHHGEEQKISIDCKNCTIEIPHKITVNKQMENGYPEIDTKKIKEYEEEFESFPPLEDTEHLGQIIDMISAIEEDKKPLVDGKDGRKTIEFILAVYQAAFTQKTVKFPMTSKDLFYTKDGIMSKVIKFNTKKKSVENFNDSTIPVGGTL